MPLRSLRSAPEQKTGPAPLTNTSRTLESDAAAAAARLRSSHIALLSALRASGRSSVIVATPACTLHLSVVNSLIVRSPLQRAGVRSRLAIGQARLEPARCAR